MIDDKINLKKQFSQFPIKSFENCSCKVDTWTVVGLYTNAMRNKIYIQQYVPVLRRKGMIKCQLYYLQNRNGMSTVKSNVYTFKLLEITKVLVVVLCTSVAFVELHEWHLSKTKGWIFWDAAYIESATSIIPFMMKLVVYILYFRWKWWCKFC